MWNEFILLIKLTILVLIPIVFILFGILVLINR